MDDRELLEFIATQVGNLTTQVGSLATKVNDIEKDIKKIGNQVTVIESEHGKKLDILFEEVVGIKEKLVEHDLRFDRIEEKIESQDIEIKVLKKAK